MRLLNSIGEEEKHKGNVNLPNDNILYNSSKYLTHTFKSNNNYKINDDLANSTLNKNLLNDAKTFKYDEFINKLNKLDEYK